MNHHKKPCIMGPSPGNATPGAAPCQPPCLAPGILEGQGFEMGHYGAGGLLNMDIGPGLLNMDIGGGGQVIGGGVYQHIPARIHVVLTCDDLTKIARLYNISEWDIMRANCLQHPGQIRVGQRLLIPGGVCY